MKELFVSYELALKLKEKGFNEPCFAMYQKNKKLWYCNKHNRITNFVINPNKRTLEFQKEYYPKNVLTVNSEDFLLNCSNFTAPLYQQVIDWLDSKGFIIEIDFADTESSYGFQFTICLKGNYEYNDLDMRHSAKRKYYFNEYFDNRYNCYNKAIEEALELI